MMLMFLASLLEIHKLTDPGPALGGWVARVIANGTKKNKRKKEKSRVTL